MGGLSAYTQYVRGRGRRRESEEPWPPPGGPARKTAVACRSVSRVEISRSPFLHPHCRSEEFVLEEFGSKSEIVFTFLVGVSRRPRSRIEQYDVRDPPVSWCIVSHWKRLDPCMTRSVVVVLWLLLVSLRCGTTRPTRPTLASTFVILFATPTCRRVIDRTAGARDRISANLRTM